MHAVQVYHPPPFSAAMWISCAQVSCSFKCRDVNGVEPSLLTTYGALLQLQADTTSINSSHIIHKVAFGPIYSGQINPLDGVLPPHLLFMLLSWPCQLCR